MKALLAIALFVTSVASFAAEKQVSCMVNLKHFNADGTLNFETAVYQSFEFTLIKRVSDTDTLTGNGEMTVSDGRVNVVAAASFSDLEAGHNGIRITLTDTKKKITTSSRTIESRDQLTLEYSSASGRATTGDISVFSICSFE